MEDKQNEGYGIVSERSGGRQRRSSGRQRPEFGSFQSDTGTGLNIRVDWSVVRGVRGEKTLEVQVSTLSYSLYSIEMPSGVELTVNGAVSVGKSAAVNYSGRSQIASPLASFSVPNLSGRSFFVR